MKNRRECDKAGGKGKVTRQRKERKRQRERAPAEGPGRRGKAPSLKALPPSLQEQLRNGRQEEEAETGKVTR